MSTRHAPVDAPVSFGKYMSHPQYAELRGIDGIASTAKGMLVSTSDRDLLFFVQAMSLREGGLPKFVDELTTAFPDRVRDSDRELVKSEMVKSLIEFCINPDCASPIAVWFRDLYGAVIEFKDSFSKAAGASMAETEVASKVNETLHRALRHRNMVVLEGDSGIGKSTAARSWTQARLGEARYVSLSGAVNKTSIFRTIGRALGIAAGYMRGATEMQARIEDMLQRSKIMLVFDEAHFLFSQGERVYSRPEMIDWIDTALCNYRVPIALVATPQLRKRLLQAEKQTIWNSEQFRRRIKEYVCLPTVIKEQDIRLVAQKVFAGCDKPSLKLITEHARLSPWPLKWIENLSEDVREILLLEGKTQIRFPDIEKALELLRSPSDVAQANAFKPVRAVKSSSRAQLPREGVESSDEATMPDKNRLNDRAFELCQ